MRKAVGIDLPVQEIRISAHLQESGPTVGFERVSDWRGHFVRGIADELVGCWVDQGRNPRCGIRGIEVALWEG